MKSLLALLASFFFGIPLFAQHTVQFYIGSLTPGPSSLITLCTLNTQTGEITRMDTVNQGKGPGYLALSPNRKFLYAATQSHEIKAFSIGEKGKLTYLNSQPANSLNPCHVSIHPSGKLAFLANYTGGSLTVLPIDAAGNVQPATLTEQYSGDGPNKPRQDKPHIHCTSTTPNGKFLYATDLGTDKLYNYRVDPASGRVTANPSQSVFSTRPGVGPRHMVVHPSGKFLFVINELDASLTALKIDKQGVLSEIQSVPTVPASFSGQNTAAAIRLHPTGKFLYVSNRGYNGITAFQINSDGTLKEVDTQTTQISMPRDFNVDPTGQFLIVANMDLDNLSLYQIDPSTGKMQFKTKSIAVLRPTCIVFVP